MLQNDVSKNISCHLAQMRKVGTAEKHSSLPLPDSVVYLLDSFDFVQYVLFTNWDRCS